MLTGSFVEGLYISTGLIKSYPKDILKDDDRTLILTPLINVVINQRKSVDELIKMLNSVEQSEPVTGLLTDLSSLQNNYGAMRIEEHLKNNRPDLVLSDKNLTELTATIEKLRKSITD